MKGKKYRETQSRGRKVESINPSKETKTFSLFLFYDLTKGGLLLLGCKSRNFDFKEQEKF